MTRLVEQEVILHAGEFAGLQRKAFDSRNPALARWLASVMSRRSSPSHSLSSGVASEPSRCSIAGSNSTSSLASSRSVGIPSMPSKSLSLSGECRQQDPRSEKRQLIEGVLALPGEGACPPLCLALGVSGASRLPTTSAADVASRRGTAAPPRAWLAGHRMRTPDPPEVERAGPERLLPPHVHENPECVAEPSNNRAPRIF